MVCKGQTTLEVWLLNKHYGQVCHIIHATDNENMEFHKSTPLC